MKRLNKNIIVLFIFVFIFITIPFVIRFSYALNDITSSEYEIKNNTIYAVPTTYNFRVEELISKINSSNELSVYNTNNELLVNGNKVSNGYTLKSGDSTYNIVVLGDVTNDGTINLGDVSKLYNFYKGKTNLNSNGIKSGDTTSDNKIDLGDVSKLYNYFRGIKAFSHFNQDMIDIDNLVDKANSYYESNTTSNLLGTNIINKLSVSSSNKDQAIITRKGEVELAINKSNKCYKKSAVSDEVKVLDEEYCDTTNNRYFSNNGRLHVTGSKLLNEYNEEFRMTGVNLATLLPTQPTPIPKECHSLKTFNTLNTWGVNGIRIFVGGKFWDHTSDEYDDYFEELKVAVNNAIANDMYVILNWNPGGSDYNPPQEDAATYFFREITNVYGNDPHILYEIWNEPEVSWSVIKEYAERIIPIIREKAQDAVCLVATPNWDKEPDKVIGNEVNLTNIMYTSHIYSGDMTEGFLNAIEKAINAGLPIFVTEWSAVAGGTPRGDYIDEAHAIAFSKFMDKYNLSNMIFCIDSGWWAYNFVDISKNLKWDDSLPDSKLREVAKFLKRILRHDYSATHFLMIENSSTTIDGLYYRDNEYREKILSVSFKTNKNVPSNAIISWDLSKLQDNTVIGYLVPSSKENMYDLVIGADGRVNLPGNSECLFKGLTNVESYDFSNVDTNIIFNLSQMFAQNKKIKTIDLSNFDTYRIRYLYSTFNGDSELTTVNFTNWTPKIIGHGMTYTFYNCEKLETVDLSGFNVSSVKDFSGLFYHNYALTNLNISTWEPLLVKKMNQMFTGVDKVGTLDLSKFTTFDNEYTIDLMFSTTQGSITVITGNNDFKNRLISEYSNLVIQ